MTLAFDIFRGISIRTVTKGKINKSAPFKSPKTFSMELFFSIDLTELQFIELLGTKQRTSVQLSFS